MVRHDRQDLRSNEKRERAYLFIKWDGGGKGENTMEHKVVIVCNHGHSYDVDFEDGPSMRISIGRLHGLVEEMEAENDCVYDIQWE